MKLPRSPEKTECQRLVYVYAAKAIRAYQEQSKEAHLDAAAAAQNVANYVRNWKQKHYGLEYFEKRFKAHEQAAECIKK